MLRSLAILLLLASSAFAGWNEPTVVNVESGGAGCFVRTPNGPRILSCAHETQSSDVRVGQVLRCTLWNDQQFTAVVQGVDTTADCSVLSFNFQLPTEITPRTIAAQVPQSGTQVWVCGFPMTTNGRYNVRVTQARGDDYGVWTVAGQGIPGESGGPVIDASGDVVGVLFGFPWDDNKRPVPVSMCSPLSAIQKLCCGRQCPNGQCPIYAQPIQPRPPVPQQRPPQVAPQPTPQPQIDWPAKYEKLESDLAELQNKFEGLQKQVGNYKECQCGDCCKQVDAKIAVAIAGIKLPQSPAIDINAIVAQVEQRQQPFYMRVDPRADYQPIKPGQYVTLPLDKLTQ